MNRNHTKMFVKPLIETEYDTCIRNYFHKELPNVLKSSKTELLEILSEILVGTKETRYGPVPVPEHIVVVRDVVRKSIELDAPIPMLVPFGGIKANKTSEIDIAEVAAIKRLTSMDDQIKRYYTPGLQVNIRVEDMGAVWLYGTFLEQTIVDYSKKFMDLTTIVAEGHNIKAVSEWDIMEDLDKYFELSKMYSAMLRDYMFYTEGHEQKLGTGLIFEALVQKGWKGIIPFEQREYYVSRYMNLEPGITRLDALKMLADYLGGAKARYDMNGKANPISEVDGYIQINFIQPVPGVPSTMFNNSLYYRTLNMSDARTHMPAWRSKGYLKIDEKGTAVPKITNWHDAEVLSKLIPSKVRIGNDTLHVEVQSDYLLV